MENEKHVIFPSNTQVKPTWKTILQSTEVEEDLQKCLQQGRHQMCNP